MESCATALPDDIDALKAMVFARDEMLSEHAERVAELQEQLSSRAIEIEHLKLTIAKLRRMQFGRKSEKLHRHTQVQALRNALKEEVHGLWISDDTAVRILARLDATTEHARKFASENNDGSAQLLHYPRA